MKPADIKPGMVLYDRHKYRMGNTTIRTLREWPVHILALEFSADALTKFVVSWNGNGAERWSWERLRKLKTWSMHDDCAEVVRGMLDRVVSVKLKKGHRAPEPRAP